MRRRTTIVSCLVLFLTLIVMTTGFEIISLDIPYEFKSHTEKKEVTLSVSPMGFTQEEVNLGRFPAWTRIEVGYSASSEVGVKIGSSKFGTPLGRNGGEYKGSDGYLLTASKSITIYLSFADQKEYDFSQIGDGYWFASQHISATINLTIRIIESSIIPSNLVFLGIFTVVCYIYLRRKYMTEWDAEYYLAPKETEKLNSMYEKNKQRCDICGKYEINNISGIGGRYCSTTCNLIYSRHIVYTISAALGAISLFIPWFIFLTYVGFGTSAYILEEDTHKYRYAQHENELTAQVVKASKGINSTITDSPILTDIRKTKYIDDLNESYLICCYQTARLNEKYCECGRAIPEKLIQYLDQ